MSHDVFKRVFDVIVVGDGFAALAAAKNSADSGLSTLMVMRRLSPGWEVCCGLLNELDKGTCDTGDAFIAALEKRSAWRDGKFCPVASEFATVELLQTAGVELLMYSTALSAIVVDGRACGVIVAGKSSVQKVLGRVIVDATDDASLCDNLGAVESPAQFSNIGAFVMDRAADGLEPQALTADDGTEFFVRPGFWKSQALISYKPDDEDQRYYETHMPAILEKIRTDIPVLANAGVTAVSADLSRSGSGPVVNDSLLPDGLVSIAIEKYSLANIIVAGEQAGSEAKKLAADTAKFGRLPDIDSSIAATALAASAKDNAKSYDVLVAGGGTAGSLACITAAREGVSTLLLEPANYLGGIATGGGIHMYYHGQPGGIQDEMDSRTSDYDKLFGGEIELRGFNPFARRVALLEMAREAGVDVIFGATVVAVDVKDAETAALAADGDKSQRVVQPSGLTAVVEGYAVKFSAKIYVDCTGDGDLAAMAGARYHIGREGDGCAHAYTQSAGVLAWAEDHYKSWATNFDSGYVDPYDVTDMTRARLLGLIPLDYENWADDDRWTYIASHLGLRQSRQIVGDYQITFADQIAGRRFEDCIGFANSHYDNHAVDYENESDAAVLWVWMMGQWRTHFGCEIPYRSLLPVGLENVIVGCRALSLSQDAHHQLRMQRDMQRLGEAAALAAVVAVQTAKTPRNIDFNLLREKLEARGCLRDENRPAPTVAALEIEKLTEILENDQPDNGLWPLMVADDSARADAMPVLKNALKSDNPMARFQSAAVLAALSDSSGSGELVDALKTRRANPREAVTIGPLWKVAAVMLGRTGGEGAVEALSEVLADKDAKIGELVLAVRSLGKIASPEAAKAVEDVLAREDVEFNIPFRHWGGSKNQPLDDSRWRLQLACAEALKAMGKDGWQKIAQDCMEDNRAYVRRKAAEILEIK